jgi:hypothetical protein
MNPFINCRGNKSPGGFFLEHIEIFPFVNEKIYDMKIQVDRLKTEGGRLSGSFSLQSVHLSSYI